MSMKTGANAQWEIPHSALKSYSPEGYEFISEHEETFIEWLQDVQIDEDIASRFVEITGSFLEHCTALGLEVYIDYTNRDDENDDEISTWMIICDNAYTINPAFKDLGGSLTLYTTYG